MNSNGIHIQQVTDYPKSGKVTVTCQADKQYIAFRIPGWCSSYSINCKYVVKDGYAYIELNQSKTIEILFDMPVKIMASNRRVHKNAGRVAVMRGPVVYCAEGIDNGADIKAVYIDPTQKFEIADSEFLLPVLTTTAYRPKVNQQLYYEAGDDFETLSLKLIPYYAFANRGETEMQVWFLRK